MNKCAYNPEPLKDVPIGMFHCPECGQMIIAGIPHLEYTEEEEEEELL